ncbi:hypothetical protein SPRG_19045 [Saprolegnia parasitica CBS 223.65]|uniref:FHA domain-containing protein n=1 Tax=Saprolegnia parasitica (strain CBS 223.65) TaxID=695850 RepID=A0A067D6C7_SAPPC|nr:hypothetical protein SPRG_19045 [Saprolegnia parasitica CBS 223.65]KDO34206.1 hypothetical protein SPRG_19045 [Saprolegnia parasitica CBS 223.65]|eukprot:XP_012195243.1 hypothetical protein SPRG_19045 [Saprolegnia parasitica CBS 223.65]
MDTASAKRAWMEDAENRKRAKSAMATAPPTGFTSLSMLDLTDDGSAPDASMGGPALARPTPRYAGAPIVGYSSLAGQYRETTAGGDDEDDLGDTLADTENIEFVASQAIMEMTQTMPFSENMVCLRLRLHPTVVANLSDDSVDKLERAGLLDVEFSPMHKPLVFGRDLFTAALNNKNDSAHVDIAKLSKEHCVFECVQDTMSSRVVVRITDRSRNGIKLNGITMVKDKPATLQHDDKITLLSSKSGSVLLGYIVEDPHVVGANATAATRPVDADRPPVTKRHIQENVLGVLFSSPLVGRDAHGRLHPIEELDLCREYDNLIKTLEDASKHASTKPEDPSVMLVPREIDVNVQFATSNNFQSMMTLGCRALHFSGHGGPKCLYFEDQESAVHPMVADELRRSFFGGPNSPLRLVVVQACHSQYCASAFLQCGIPHVIAVKVEERLEDQAAIVFTKNFYLALGQGKSVAESFEIGRHAVSVYPHLPHAIKAASKFQLLPEGDDHNEVIFPMVELPLVEYESQVPSSQRFPVVWSSKLPSLCQHFRHREADQYYVCSHFSTMSQTQKFVWLVGPAGVGKTQLSYATAKYLGARKVFPAGIRFLHVGKIQRVATWLARTFDNATMEQHGLLVLDGVDPLLEREEHDFIKWIEALCTQYSSLRLLITARKQVVSPVFQTHGGRMQHLHPFGPAQAVDLLRRLLGKDRGLSLSEVSASPIAHQKNHPDPNTNLSLVLEQHPAVRQTGFLPREIAALASRLVAAKTTPLDAYVNP